MFVFIKNSLYIITTLEISHKIFLFNTLKMTQNLTILFDLDGTIVNTAPDLMAAHNHVMRKFGYEEKKMADIKTLAGKGAWVMMQRSFKEKINDEN